MDYTRRGPLVIAGSPMTSADACRAARRQRHRHAQLRGSHARSAQRDRRCCLPPRARKFTRRILADAVTLGPLSTGYKRRGIMASDVAPIKELLDRAFERTRAALNDPRAVEWLHDYYDPDSNYAGATFLTLQP